MSREKLIAKLLVTIQSFVYSCCCESFEARRNYLKVHSINYGPAGRLNSNLSTILSKFGFASCDGSLIIMPRPNSFEDEGSQPFAGRLGKLRYFGLSAMAAAGAIAADLVQLVLPFPTDNFDSEAFERLRSPIAYPLLFGHVLTHVTAAICAACGRTRARRDSLEGMVWPIPFSSRGSFISSASASAEDHSLRNDCDSFLKLGLLARLLQTLLGKLQLPSIGVVCPRTMVAHLQALCASLEGKSSIAELAWIKTCTSLVCVAMSMQVDGTDDEETTRFTAPTAATLKMACLSARSNASKYMIDMGIILQLLVPGYIFESAVVDEKIDTFDQLLLQFQIEPLDTIISSPIVQQVVANWYDVACNHAKELCKGDDVGDFEERATLRRRLFRTQGYRSVDWPAPHTDEDYGEKSVNQSTEAKLPSQSISPLPMHLETISLVTRSPSFQRQGLVASSAKKSSPLLGGATIMSKRTHLQADIPSRITALPTSYTDLYAELGALLPDSDQSAVCLICGQVFRVNGKGDCTRHSYECGAGVGLFFLLQECSGLIMHKSQAAYIPSFYVDSHGETPQFRGRPLNLDLVRYEHLREAWLGHGIRQMVVAERANSRQVILNDFY
jgi:hypothetical protein